MTFNNEFKIIINNKPGCDLKEIYLIELINGKVYNGKIDKNGFIEFVEVDETSALKNEQPPFLRIQGRYWGDFVRAISNDLSNVTRDEIDAELKATKYHLEDLRKLVFKNKRI